MTDGLASAHIRNAEGVPRRVVFFVNGRARRGHAALKLAQLLVRHPEIEAVSEQWHPRHEADVFAFARALPPHAVAVAVGGDGTVNLLARALCAARPRAPNTLAVVPLGTGNAFAHGLGIHSPERAMRVIHDGQAIPLDVMRTSRSELDLALVSISTGFEAEFMAAIAARRARHGIALSAVRALRSMFAAPWRGAQVVLEGASVLDESEIFYNAGLYNLPCYAFGWRVVPEAVPADGQAQAIVHAGAGGYWWALIGALAGGRVRGGRRRGFRQAHLVSPRAFQIDGEVLAGGELEVWVEPGALMVLVGRERRFSV